MVISKDFQLFTPRLVSYILTWKSLMNRAQYNSWRYCSRLRRRLVLVLKIVPQLPQEKLVFATLRRFVLLWGDLLSQCTSYNKARTHLMIICALEGSVPFVLGNSSLGKKQVKEHDDTTWRQLKAGLSTGICLSAGRQVKVYLHFCKT